MDSPEPTRTDVHDGLRLSPVPVPHGGRVGKKSHRPTTIAQSASNTTGYP